MNMSDVNALTTQVLWVVFGLAVVFGAIAQKTHFCTMGAVSDIVNMGDWSRMRMWVLAMAVAMLGFNGMVAAGWVQASHSIYTSPRLLWLSALWGGLMFGFGMVLASGCGSKTLVRIGGGSLKSLVVFLVVGAAAFATMKGITAVLRVATIDRVSLDLATGQDLPSLLAGALGAGRPTWALVVGGGLALVLMAWVFKAREGRSADVLLGGVGIGSVVVAAWYASGHFGHVSEHPETLEAAFLATNSQRMESLSFVAPMAYTLDWLMFFSDKSKVLSMGIVSALGVVLGSAIVATATHSFRWEGFASAEDTAHHIVGGTLMGVGGVTALGCTIGQGVSGVSTLALGSFIALAAIIGGAVLALRYQMWRLERQV